MPNSDFDPSRDFDLETKEASIIISEHEDDARQCAKVNLQIQAVFTTNALRNLAAHFDREIPHAALREHADDLERAVRESNRR